MSEAQSDVFHQAEDAEAEYQTLDLLHPDSYTAHRLKHASPEHLHLTTRRCFIGPIPEGWLKDHRRDWYKHHLHIHYSSRSASFRAASNTGPDRRVTGIDGYGDSGPSKLSQASQPESKISDHFDTEQQEEARSDAPVVAEESPAIDVPRTLESEQSPPKTNKNVDSGGARPVTKPPTSRLDSPALGNSSNPPSNFSKQQKSNISAASTASTASTVRPAKPKLLSRNTGKSSFVTAKESLDSLSDASNAPNENATDPDETPAQEPSSSENRDSVVRPSSLAASSTAPLVKPAPHDTSDKDESPQQQQQQQSKQPQKGILARVRSRGGQQDQDAQSHSTAKNPDLRTASGLVRFNLPDEEAKVTQREELVKVRLAQFRRRDTLKRLRRGKIKDGEILKYEKMLVRVDFTTHELQDEFDENDSRKIESRTLDEWREFIVVCRESAGDEEEFVLQFYKTRVIKAVEKATSKKRAAHQVTLNSQTKINIFSSLDKTIVLWERYKGGRRLFIMRPHSGADSMEWFTFLRNLLGWQRNPFLQVNVPDLQVSLRVEDPFENLESSETLTKAAEGDEEALTKALEEEHAVAGKIVLRCMDMLESAPELGPIVDAWAAQSCLDSHAPSTTIVESDQTNINPLLHQIAHSSVGLAWKRYDRLEWVHGANERSMYGTIGMEKSHDLELRPKQHYPTSIIRANGKAMAEPAPIEGFLIRLTSQKGNTRRFGRLFFKRLYFSTHNQYLIFNRPAQADPPPPPKLPMRKDTKVPSASQIVKAMPLIFAVNPYPIHEGEIEWLRNENYTTRDEIEKHDQDAYDENERRTSQLLKCDGAINLCDIVRVRKMRHGTTPADENMEEGSDADFHEEVPDDTGEDGSTSQLDEERTFELVLKNGLVLRLQAYNKTTKQEWMRRMRRLVNYWTQRVTQDIDLYKSVRRNNLDRLKINEDIEAAVGQFAKKWEVRQSYASPELYHMCGISCCRAVQMSGVLYRKAKLHASFQRCRVVLTHGHLLLFEETMRSRTGKVIPHIQHQRVTSLDLNDCYIYSGLITSNDMTYDPGANSFDRAHPGSHHGLPRMYLEDGWSSTDEDTMTSFVIWHGKKRSWFRSEKAQGRGQNAKSKVKLVGQLGKEGRAVVFKTRSRAERDHWVMNVALEIERLSGREEIRIVE